MDVKDSPLLGKVTACQACSAPTLELIIDFLPQPPVQAFLTPEALGEPEIHYPLDLYRCTTCDLVQLGYIPDPSVVFPHDYPYQSGMTRILREDFADLAANAADRYGLGPDKLVIDIGSNDGTLLKAFAEHGATVLGVEPTDIASIAEKNGVPTINEFFSDEVAHQIVADKGKAAIITAANVLAHVNNLGSFLRGVATLLDEDGVFVSESHYLLDLIQKLQYDTIYHEHLRFYGLRPLTRILEGAGFKVVDVQRVPTHGGSIRVWSTKNHEAAVAPAVAERQAEEEAYGLYEPQRLVEFAGRVRASKAALLAHIIDLRREGRRIVGVGAPARSSMLLNYSHLDADLIDYIVEPAGSLKNGLHTPGGRIPIVEESMMFDEQPDCALLLSWHIGEELRRSLQEKGFRGSFLIPLPEPRLIEA
jgi:SAM-dependent methyltransferase